MLPRVLCVLGLSQLVVSSPPPPPSTLQPPPRHTSSLTFLGSCPCWGLRPDGRTVRAGAYPIGHAPPQSLNAKMQSRRRSSVWPPECRWTSVGSRSAPSDRTRKVHRRRFQGIKCPDRAPAGRGGHACPWHNDATLERNARRRASETFPLDTPFPHGCPPVLLFHRIFLTAGSRSRRHIATKPGIHVEARALV